MRKFSPAEEPEREGRSTKWNSRHRLAHGGLPPRRRVTTQHWGNHPAGRDQYLKKKKKEKKLVKISIYASSGQFLDSHFGWVAL